MVSESTDSSCINCGYDQRGNPDSVVCPECGFVSEGESYEFGHIRSRWFNPLLAVGFIGIFLLSQVEANPWLTLAFAILLVGFIAWDILAKRLRPNGQILVNETGFRVINTASPHGRWVTWDKVVNVNDPGVVNIIFIAVKDPHARLIEVGPTKNAKQRNKVLAAIARCNPTTRPADAKTTS